MKSKDNRNPYLAQSKYHGTGGYLTVQEPPFRTPLVAAFVDGSVEMGYENRDLGEYKRVLNQPVSFVSDNTSI